MNDGVMAGVGDCAPAAGEKGLETGDHRTEHGPLPCRLFCFCGSLQLDLDNITVKVTARFTGKETFHERLYYIFGAVTRISSGLRRDDRDHLQFHPPSSGRHRLSSSSSAETSTVQAG